MCVGTGGRESRRKREEGKRRAEGGQTEATETEKHTSQVQRAWSEATETLFSVTNSFFPPFFCFFLFLPELLSRRTVVHGGYMLILTLYTSGILIVETNHRVRASARLSLSETKGGEKA